MTQRELLLGIAIKYHGDWDLILSAIDRKEIEGIEEYSKSYTGNYITILDDAYPKELKCIRKPPIVLFYKGDINLLKDVKNTYCITGDRKTALKTLDQVEKACKDYEDKTLINSLALGVSTYALMSVKKAIIVLANGLDNIYPPQNKKLLNEKINSGSLVITEYPDDVYPEQNNFLHRQRIIAGLSNELILIDCNKKTGSEILVAHMLQHEKEVKCVPDTDNPDSLCNQLIEEGATPVFKWCYNK